MRLDIKLAIVQSGQPQYAIAQQIGVPESRLSKFIHGYGTLRQEHVDKLQVLLGLTNMDHPESTQDGEHAKSRAPLWTGLGHNPRA